MAIRDIAGREELIVRYCTCCGTDYDSLPIKERQYIAEAASMIYEAITKLNEAADIIRNHTIGVAYLVRRGMAGKALFYRKDHKELKAFIDWCTEEYNLTPKEINPLFERGSDSAELKWIRRLFDRHADMDADHNLLLLKIEELENNLGRALKNNAELRKQLKKARAQESEQTEDADNILDFIPEEPLD